MPQFLSRKIPSGFETLPGVRLFAIGDIHGRADLLRATMEKIEMQLTTNPVPRNWLIFLGDYIDRGPDTREVINSLIEISQRYEAIFLRGNHEAFVEEFLHNPSVLSFWKQLGGLETLASYGVAPPLSANATEQIELAKAFQEALPNEHLDFLNRLVTSFSCGDIFFAHAGVRPGVPIARQADADLMWIRDEFLLHQGLFEKLIVHGHTPVRTPDIRQNRINIDTGAYVTGKLTCLWMEKDDCGFL